MPIPSSPAEILPAAARETLPVIVWPEEPPVLSPLPAEAESDDVRTGDARVDAVLESLEGLDERPLAEHTAVFEQAHERLREALDPDSGAGPTPDLRSA